MLERLLLLKPHVMRVTFELEEKSCDKIFLKDEEWHHVAATVNVLRPAFEATTLLEGEKYSTLSFVYPVIQTLFWDYKNDQKWANGETTEAR